jgi:hypothetical protein
VTRLILGLILVLVAIGIVIFYVGNKDTATVTGVPDEEYELFGKYEGQSIVNLAGEVSDVTEGGIKVTIFDAQEQKEYNIAISADTLLVLHKFGEQNEPLDRSALVAGAYVNVRALESDLSKPRIPAIQVLLMEIPE